MAGRQSQTRSRCGWAGTDPTMVAYHDEEWGVPLHEDRRLFEFLMLEGAQAGLSWQTILHKRDAYRERFHRFDPARVARMTPRTVEKLVHDAAIVRHRGKIEATVSGARAFLAVQEEFGSFDRWIWEFVGGTPVQNRWRRMDEVPARTELSDRVSRELKRRGFKFVGGTICYAFLQATGMVNDHLVDCFRHDEVRAR